MGVGGLESHSTSKKHKQIVSDRSKNYSMFFGKSSVSSPDAEKSVENLSETVCKKNNTLDNLIAVNNSSLNVEILWRLKVINAHWNCNSCTDIAKLFHSMFPDSEIEGQFSMGKTKCRYIILYGLAPHFKSKLREAINSSIYSLSFDENLNSFQQKCQMDLNVRFWNESINIVGTRYYDSKFLETPNAENLLESTKDASNGLRQLFTISHGWTECKLGSVKKNR